MKKLLLLSLCFIFHSKPLFAGPILDTMSRHKTLIGAALLSYSVIFGIHWGLDRVDKETISKEAYETLKAKIVSGQATIQEVFTFFRLFIFPGSKVDLVDCMTEKYDINGHRMEIQGKYLNQAGSGIPAWIQRRIFDNLEKITKPLLSFCALMWIVDRGFAEGIIPGK